MHGDSKDIKSGMRLRKLPFIRRRANQRQQDEKLEPGELLMKVPEST
jgi:hypothetical protein